MQVHTMKLPILLIFDYPSKKFDFSAGSIEECFYSIGKHFQKVGKSMQEFHILCLHPVHPKVKSPDPMDKEALLKNIQQLGHLDLIMCFGSLSFNAIIGKTVTGKNIKDPKAEALRRHRGSFYFFKETPVVSTYHPEDAVIDYLLHTVISMDIQKAFRHYKQPLPPQRTIHISPSLTEVEEYLNECSLKDDISIDIETAHSQMVCCSFALSPFESMTIPTTKKYWGGWPRMKYALGCMDSAINRNTPNPKQIGQNFSYDIQYLTRIYGIFVKQRWEDTMLMQHVTYSELPKSLAFLCSIYTLEPYYKDALKEWMDSDLPEDEGLWTYCAKDSAVTFEIWEKLSRQINAEGNRGAYEHDRGLLEPLMFMMLRGVNADREQMRIDRELYGNEIISDMEIFKEEYGDYNTNSPKQMKGLILSLGLEVPKIKGKETTCKKAIEKLAKNNEGLAKIVDLRSGGKMLGTYLSDSLLDIDGRMRCSFNIASNPNHKTHKEKILKGGRLSSSESIWGCGTNLQNQPKKMRNIFIPDPGKVFTAADKQGAEARVVAYLSKDWKIIDLLNNGGNIHNKTVRDIWGQSISDEEIEKDKTHWKEQGTPIKSMYDKAKRTRHAYNYKVTWFTLKDILSIEAKEAKHLIEQFSIGNPELKQWQDEVIREVSRTRCLTSPMGRKRRFLGRIDQDMFKEAVSFMPQETVAYDVNEGMIKVYDNMCCWKEIDLLLQIHDELLFQHAPEDTEFVHQELRRLMENPITINGMTFTIPVDIKTGPNWRDMSAIKDFSNIEAIEVKPKFKYEDILAGLRG